MLDKKIFGIRLRALRTDKHETQTVLGNVLGVSKVQISDLENGKTTTTLEKLVLLCEHYQVSADYLLGLSDER